MLMIMIGLLPPMSTVMRMMSEADPPPVAKREPSHGDYSASYLHFWRAVGTRSIIQDIIDHLIVIRIGIGIRIGRA